MNFTSPVLIETTRWHRVRRTGVFGELPIRNIGQIYSNKVFVANVIECAWVLYDILFLFFLRHACYFSP